MTSKKRIILQAFLALFLILVGSLGFKMLKSSRQALGRQQAEIPLPMVRTVPVSMGDIEMILTGEGTVHPVSQIQMVPEISGKVVYVSPHLINGGTFKAGERLMTIEPANYRIAVTLAEANVKDAQSKFELARQLSEAACGEWEQLNNGKTPPPLVAKQPQLEAARANLNAQEANLEKARLNLDRTEIVAPFNGRVSNETVDPGQYVNPGQSLATLYCTDAAEIVVPMETSALNWFAVPGFTTDDDDGASVEVVADVAGAKRTWTGEVVRVEGTIDAKTRMMHVVIRIANPYATKPPLAIGQFAEVRIKGATLPGCAIIPRAALHGDNIVWAVDSEERLCFRTVDIARMDSRGVVIRSGLKPTDHVVVSPLKAATDGMRVRHVKAGSDGRRS